MRSPLSLGIPPAPTADVAAAGRASGEGFVLRRSFLSSPFLWLWRWRQLLNGLFKFPARCVGFLDALAIDFLVFRLGEFLRPLVRVHPRIPKGFRHPAQGCSPRATLGNRATNRPNPERVASSGAPNVPQPRWGCLRHCHPPRVARAAQPWDDGLNPLGIRGRAQMIAALWPARWVVRDRSCF